jgi:DnaJ like chaperone protein
LQLKGKILSSLIFFILGDLTGLPFGGVVGAILGALLGHFFYDEPRTQTEKKDQKAYQKRKSVFVFHVFSLCAKMAKADGKISHAEINLMEKLIRQQFRMSDKARTQAVKIWKDAKDSDKHFDEYARAFYLDFSKERVQILDMMNLLFEIAAVDGRLHPREEELLLRAAGIFHIGRLQYDRIKGRFFQDPKQQPQVWKATDPHYAILGAEPQDSVDIIKKKYRELAKKWHPDKMTASGASSEVLRHAKEKFQQINEAYEKILQTKKK